LSRREVLERVLERLKAGETWEKVSGDLRSRSTLYRALREYFSWAGRKVDEYQEKIRILHSECEGLSEEQKRLKSGLMELEGSKDSLEKSVGDYELIVRDLVSKIDENSRKNLSLKMSLKKLSDLGVKEEVIGRINRIDFGSGDELLERVSKLEEYNKLLVDKERLEDEISMANSEVAKLGDRKKELQKSIQTEVNRLDEVKRANWLYEGANQVVQGFLKRGYGIDILLDIAEALKTLEIEEEPETSIKRLIDGLRGIKNLRELEAAIRGKEGELQKTKLELIHLNGALFAVKEQLLRTVEDATDKAIKRFETGTEGLMKVQSSQLEEFRKNAEATMSKIVVDNANHIERCIGLLESRLKALELQVQRWGEEKQKMGEMRKAMDNANILLDVMEPRKELSKIPENLITRLQKSITDWTWHNKPEATIIPIQVDIDLDNNLQHGKSYKVAVMGDMLTRYYESISRK